jgi:nitrate/nitrite transport system substrate-binding protein
MVANMKVGKMNGFCVGEPWNARAVADDIGYTAVTTQQIWPDHPEKVFALTADFADKNPKTVKALLRALTESSQYIDKMENRPHVAEIVSKPQYINVAPEIILGRLQGDYVYGDGRTAHDPLYMTFYDRETNFPWQSHGLWWLSQFRRWGMIGDGVDYASVARSVNRTDAYREVAKEMSITLAAADVKKEKLFDGVEFDPADPERYARGFAVNSVA